MTDLPPLTAKETAFLEEIIALRKALGMAVASIKAGERWHNPFDGCASCNEINMVLNRSFVEEVLYEKKKPT